MSHFDVFDVAAGCVSSDRTFGRMRGRRRRSWAGVACSGSCVGVACSCRLLRSLCCSLCSTFSNQWGRIRECGLRKEDFLKFFLIYFRWFVHFRHFQFLRCRSAGMNMPSAAWRCEWRGVVRDASSSPAQARRCVWTRRPTGRSRRLHSSRRRCSCPTLLASISRLVARAAETPTASVDLFVWLRCN